LLALRAESVETPFLTVQPMICWTSQQYIEPTSILVTEKSAKLPKYNTLTTISKNPECTFAPLKTYKEGRKILKESV
jgi:hypothetical protein